MDAQVLKREVQIQGVICTSQMHWSQLICMILRKPSKTLDRQHCWKPRDFNPNVKSKWDQDGRKMSLVLANFNGFAKSLKSVRASYIFDRWRDRSE